MWGILSLFGIGAGLANDARIHNQKYFGTERDVYRNNPRVQANRSNCEEMYEDTNLMKFFGVQRPSNLTPDEWRVQLRQMKADYERETGKRIPRWDERLR